MAWMLTLFWIFFHLVVSVCSERQGPHNDKVCIVSPYDLNDVANFETDILFLASDLTGILMSNKD